MPVIAVIASAADDDPNTAGSIAGLLIIAAIGVGIFLISRHNKRTAAKKLADHEAAVRDKLAAEGLAPRIVTRAMHAHRFVKKGQTKTRYIPCVVALNDNQLIRVGMWEGDRSTIHLVDVAGSSISGSVVTVDLLGGQRMSFRAAENSADAVGKMAELEAALTRSVSWLKNGTRGAQASVSAELARLAELRNEGVIDDSDWGRAKDLFLGKQEDERDRAARELRQLHELKRSGVLSESEFNMKKWDVLARTK